MVAPDLNIDGQLLGSAGIQKSDKQYLKQIMNYLQGVSRAPWYLQRGQVLNDEIWRLFNSGLSKPAKRIGVKLLDYIYFKEGEDSEALVPIKVKISNKNAAVTELVMFLLIFVYLCAIYALVVYL